jgi:hypothetical protein
MERIMRSAFCFTDDHRNCLTDYCSCECHLPSLTEQDKKLIIFALGGLHTNLLKNPNPLFKPEDCVGLAKKLGAKLD